MSSTLYSPHLTHEDLLQPIKDTFVGQAHVAGTGPDGKTCRECKKWYSIATDSTPRKHSYSSDEDPSDESRDMHLKDHPCQHRILNKSCQAFPHTAKACRFFEQSTSPPPQSRARICGGRKTGSRSHEVPSKSPGSDYHSCICPPVYSGLPSLDFPMMECPKCGGEARITDSRPYKQSTLRRRQYVCTECPHSFKTFELSEALISLFAGQIPAPNDTIELPDWMQK